MLILAALIVLGIVWWLYWRPSAPRRRRRDSGDGGGDAARAVVAERRSMMTVGPPVADAVVEMLGVSKSYGRGERSRLALDGLDLRVPAGEVFGLLGRNGAGKTTAMRCMLGLVRPGAGTCRILGADSGRDLHRVIGRVGALIEAPGLIPSLSGQQNLLLLARLDRIGVADVDRALRTAGLDERADDAVSTYSLGMRQRLGIAASLLRDPEVLILDEPANGLDPPGIAEIRELLVALAREGRSVIISSHMLDEVERTCDRVAIIEAGHCVASGPVADVLAGAGAHTLVTRVADLVAARDALARAGIDSVVSNGALRVSCAPADGARVTEILAHEHLYVSELRPEHPTLEAVFLGLTSTDARAH